MTAQVKGTSLDDQFFKGTSLDDTRCAPKADFGRAHPYNYRQRSAASPPRLLRQPSSAPATPEKNQTEKIRRAPASAPAKKKLCCDACDGEHLTSKCPHFKNKRDEHPDASKGLGPKGLGSTSGNFTLKDAAVKYQPPDGSCLFHSLAEGLHPTGISASALRTRIAVWLADNPDLMVGESPLRDWVEWDTNKSVAAYAMNMARSGVWGGGIEMAACSIIFGVNIWVYEVEDLGDEECGPFKRISCFNRPDGDTKNVEEEGGAPITIHVLYGGEIHFDTLLPAPGTVLPFPERPEPRKASLGGHRKEDTKAGKKGEKSAYEEKDRSERRRPYGAGAGVLPSEKSWAQTPRDPRSFFVPPTAASTRPAASFYRQQSMPATTGTTTVGPALRGGGGAPSAPATDGGLRGRSVGRGGVGGAPAHSVNRGLSAPRGVQQMPTQKKSPAPPPRRGDSRRRSVGAPRGSSVAL